MERQRFEDSWKESFKDSEISPSDSLWTNIELDIEKAEGKVMKKRVLYFKLLAAASIGFAMTFAGVGGYYLLTQKDTQFAQQQIKSTEQTQEASVAQRENETRASVEKSEIAVNDQESTQGVIGDPKEKNTNTDKAVGSSTRKTKNSSIDRNASSENSVAVASNVNGNEAGENLNNGNVSTSGTNAAGNNAVIESTSATSGTQIASVSAVPGPENKQPNTPDDLLLPLSGSLPVIAHVNRPSVPVEYTTQSTADPVALMLAKQTEIEKSLAAKESKEKKDKKKNDRERMWTSVGFAAGSFNTVNPGSNSLPTANSPIGKDNAFLSNYNVANNIVQNQSSAAGKSYSAGVSMGGKVSDRWVLQGGVNYLSQSSLYTTNAVVEVEGTLGQPNESYKAASIAEISNAGKTDSRLVNTSSYEVNSNLQYLSVPLQAGYMIINRAVGLQFNAGVSTDLFLQSTLTPDGGSLEKSTQGNGDDSPYRPVNFSGLVGTELSYRFGYRYRVSINPGLRYPFSSIYKSDIALSANPLTFDVGLQFRYIFN